MKGFTSFEKNSVNLLGRKWRKLLVVPVSPSVIMGDRIWRQTVAAKNDTVGANVIPGIVPESIGHAIKAPAPLEIHVHEDNVVVIGES